ADAQAVEARASRRRRRRGLTITARPIELTHLSAHSRGSGNPDGELRHLSTSAVFPLSRERADGSNRINLCETFSNRKSACPVDRLSADRGQTISTKSTT